LQFKARFKAGTDERHEAFITDNDSRETFETWEACLAEGVRQRKVEKELPEKVQQLHDESLKEGRDILKSADDDEKKRWLTKTGTDWSGAFGEDPKAYMDSQGRKKREPGVDKPLHDPYHPSSDEDNDDDDDDSSDSSDDLGIQDAETSSNTNGAARGSTSMDGTTDSSIARTSTSRTSTEGGVNRQNKRTEERKQRGLMQWKPARNAKFAKDQTKIGIRRLKNKLTGGLDGRQPGVETETAT